MARLLTSTSTTPPPTVRDMLRQWAADVDCNPIAICGLSIIEYAERVKGRKVRPSPRYLTPIAIACIRYRPGSFSQFASWVMWQLDCPPTWVPRYGDVGLCDVPEVGLVAALCTGRSPTNGALLWAVRSDQGVTIAPLKFVRAWRVEAELCPRQ
jgi:hypothetical protein